MSVRIVFLYTHDLSSSVAIIMLLSPHILIHVIEETTATDDGLKRLGVQRVHKGA